MKNLIITILCLLLLMVPWSIYHRFSDTSINRYKDIIMNQTIPAAKSGDWHHAESSFDSIAKDWNKFRKISVYFIDTKSLNEVTDQISRASCYLQEQDVMNTVVETTILQHKLDHLHKNDAPSVDNIF